MNSSSIFRKIVNILIRFLKYQDKRFTGLAMRFMKWQGRAKYPIHPKHLYDDNRNQFLLSLMKPDMMFLDIGSGSGSECLNAFEKGASYVYGVEYNRESIALSHERLVKYKNKYDIFDLNLEGGKIPVSDHSIDLICFSNVLEHLHNRKAILEELRRVLKPSGTMYIAIPNTNTPWKILQREYGVDSRDDDDHKIEYSIETLHQEMAGAGLKIVTDLHPVVPSWPFNGIIAFCAVISPRLYKKLQNWKHSFAKENPEHSVGWYFLAQPV